MAAKERFGWIAILDILGFTDLMNRKDKKWIYENVVKWTKTRINELAMNENASAEETDKENWDYGGWDSRHYPVGTMFFADTVILYTDEPHKQVRSDWPIRIMSNVMSRFLTEALSRKLLFRGAISKGDYLVDNDFPAIIGKCVVEAHQLELAQNWAGVALCRSALYQPEEPFMNYVNEFYEEYEANNDFYYPSSKLISYPLPLKTNWTNNWASCGDEWAKLLRTTSKSELIQKVSDFYDKFAIKSEDGNKSPLHWVINWKPKIEFIQNLLLKLPKPAQEKLNNTFRFIKTLRDRSAIA